MDEMDKAHDPVCSLDIGFDREALPRPDSPKKKHPLYPLQFGVTVIDDHRTNPVAQARHLVPGETLLFTLYDLTEKLGKDSKKTSSVIEMSFRICFQKAREQPVESPTRHADYERFSIHPGELTPGYSTVFEHHFHNWNVFPPESEGREGLGESLAKKFPKNQLDLRPLPPPEAGIPLEFVGHFYFTLELVVEWKTGDESRRRARKHYRTDPEIILSNNGFHPGDEEDSPES